MRLRIESDGTAHSTRVVDVETGRTVPVQAVTWTMDVRENRMNMATATIVVPLVEVCIEADAVVDGALHFVSRTPPTARASG